jgi:hypothetical protein
MLARVTLIVLMHLIGALFFVPSAGADGDETLGPPDLTLAAGTGVVVAGVGMQANLNTPATIDVDVPSGAEVKQVLVYWQGQHSSNLWPASVPDGEITLNGNPVTGVWTATSINPYFGERFYTYRYDATALELVGPGENTLTVDELFFESTSYLPTGNKGVGVAVIYDDGSDSTLAGLIDGMDYAYSGFSPPLSTTEAQTFTFEPSPYERTGSLGLMVGEALDFDYSGVQGLVVEGEFDTSETFSLVNELQSNQGFELDAAEHEITIPAGAESVTVQLLSLGGDTPASFAWFFASLDIEAAAPPPVTANLWVNTAAGASPGPRCDIACPYTATDAYGRMIDAVAAASCGDVIRVKAGSYGKQGALTKSCSGSSKITLLGEDGVVIDSGVERATEGGCENPPPNTCAYNTFGLQGDILAINVDVTGHNPIVLFFGDGNEWRDSTYTMYPGAVRHYLADEPLLVQDGCSGHTEGSCASDNPTATEYRITNNVLRRITFGEFRSCYNDDAANGCPPGDTGHLELIRIGGGVDGLLMDGVTFGKCTSNPPNWVGCGSGQIFITSCQITGCAPPKNITVQNSRFFDSPSHIQNSSQALPSNVPDLNWTFAYNTTAGGDLLSLSRDIPGTQVIGNVGGQAPCLPAYTHVRNVVVTDDPACGTNTVTGTSSASLGLNATTLSPESGSPAIDGGETGGYCTTSFSFGTPGLASIDGAGNPRPLGTICDAGWAEVG